MENTLLIPGLENVKASPDYTRLRDAILRQGRSDRLPFMELFADPEIMQAILGRPFTTIQDRIEFNYRLGYDSAPIFPDLAFPSSRNVSKDTAELSRGDRQWITEETCPIKTWEDFERYEWPDPELCNTQSIEDAVKYLPEGMGLVLQSGGIL